MRKILLLIAFLSFVLVGCGEPESYGMTSDEFKNKYEKQVKECRQTCKRVSDRKYFIPANDVEEKGKRST